MSPAGSSGGSAVAVASGMLPIAQGTDFGCSIRIPAAFCGIVGIRPTPGLTPNSPMPLAWDPGQVHGPLARTAEDAALMLDAMVGFSRLSPISVAPPWPSAAEIVEQCARRQGAARCLCTRDIAGIGVDCRDRGDLPQGGNATCASTAPPSTRSISIVSDGRDPYKTWRGVWMVGQQLAHLRGSMSSATNLKGNVKSGLMVTTTRSSPRPSARALRCSRKCASCSSDSTCCSRRPRR